MLPKTLQMIWIISIARVWPFLITVVGGAGIWLNSGDTEMLPEWNCYWKWNPCCGPNVTTLLAMKRIFFFFICFDSDSESLILDWNENLGKSLNSLHGVHFLQYVGVEIRGSLRNILIHRVTESACMWEVLLDGRLRRKQISPNSCNILGVEGSEWENNY